MKILITGAEGFVGTELIHQLNKEKKVEIFGIVHQTDAGINNYHRIFGDITNEAFVCNTISAIKPNLVVHAAALSQADYCEEHKEECEKINVGATKSILLAAEKVGASLIFLSTSFVFDGEDGPYEEGDAPNPVNEYGKSKFRAEQLVQQYPHNWAIVRTLLVYGKKTFNGRHNILSKAWENLLAGNKMSIVDDQQRTPTYINDLVRFIIKIIYENLQGIYHISGVEIMTPYELVLELCKHINGDEALLQPISTKDLNEPAKRPLNSLFSCEKAINKHNYSPTSFQKALQQILND